MQYVCVLYTIYYFVETHPGEACCAYLLIYSSTVAILVDLHKQQFINTSLFEFTIKLSRALKHIYIFLVSQYLIYFFLFLSFKFSIFCYSQGSSFLFIFRNIRRVTNIIFTISLRKYPVFRASYLATRGSNVWHYQEGKVFYLPYFRSRVCLNWYRFQQKNLKEPAPSILPTILGLGEDVIYVSQGQIPMSGGDTTYQWSLEEPGLTSRSDQLVDASTCPQ